MEPGDIFVRKYRIERRLGQGGFAEVYLATHLEIDQRVAIKMLQKESAEPRFVREGKVLASLRSPYTLRILDFGRDDETGQPYLISEFVDGVPLGNVMREGPLPWPTVARMMDQLLSSLAEAHTAGVVHRDIKPDNIMRQANGDVKVLDFGIARVLEHQTLTGPGAIIGTPRYMAPEALLNAGLSQPSIDVYAVGLVAYGLLVGRPAVAADTMKAQLARQLDGQPHVLPGAVQLPPGARRWVERMCAKAPTERPADAGVALHELRELARRSDKPEVPESPVETRTPPERRDQSQLALTVIATVVVLLFAGAFMWSVRSEARGWLSPEPVGAPVHQSPPSFVRPPSPVSERTAEPEPQPEPEPEPEPEVEAVDVSAAFERGREALEEQRWMDAAEAFAEVREAPESAEAKLSARKGYIRQAIEEVLDLPPGPDAREKVARLVDLYPDDERARARLAELEKLVVEAPKLAAAAPRKTKKAPSTPSVKPEGGIEIIRGNVDVVEQPKESPPPAAQERKKTSGRPKAEVNAAMRQQLREFRPCDDTVSERTHVQVRFRVLPSGKTYRAELLEAEHRGTEMWDCMVEAAHRLRFKPVDPGYVDLLLTVPVTLIPAR